MISKGIVVSTVRLLLLAKNNHAYHVAQVIPTLKQAQMFEVLAKAGRNYASKPEDPHEGQIYLALRILRLASHCRVSVMQL